MPYESITVDQPIFEKKIVSKDKEVIRNAMAMDTDNSQPVIESIIREARQNDAAALVALMHANGWFTRMESETQEETLTYLSRQLDLCIAGTSHSLYVACDAEQALVGYVAAHWLPCLFLTGPEGFVSELFVDAAARGRGLGTRLLATIEKEARQRGCSRLQLINFRSRESYQRGFYGRLGWIEREDAASFTLKLE